MKRMSLDNLASQEELDTLRQVDSMTHEPGFGPDQAGGGDSLADLGFSSLDLSGGGGFGDHMAQGGGGGVMGGFQNSLELQQQQQAAQTGPDWGDIVIESAGKGLKATGKLFKELLKSIASRTADDIGYFGRNAMIAGIPAVITGILFLIMAGPTGWKGFGFFGLGGILLLAGIGTSGVGALTMGIAAELTGAKPVSPAEAMEELSDTADQAVEPYVENIEDSVGNVVTDDLLAELNDILSDTPDFSASPEPVSAGIEQEPDIDLPELPDFDELDKQVQATKKTLTRDNLLSTFLPYFMQKTPKFRETITITPDSQVYEIIRATIIKAIANLQNLPIEKVTQRCISIEETFFSYKVVFERVKKMKNTKDIATELETYFRATVDPEGLTEEEVRNQRLRIKVTVEPVADTWEITINKGTSGIITMGDILAGEREYNYFKNEKNALPYIAGITELGSVLLDDAGNALEMLISGKQRSGKSWYVNSILTSIVTFNPPEDVALIINDPKNSTMFNTLALFPHVIGLHNGDNILEIFREVIDVEAPKRAELLRQARCENIKDYNKKFPDKKMPYLFIVIDEVLSIRDCLAQVRDGEKEADAKARMREFTSSLLVILSKLPYIGVGIIMVPHRATGVIDKTSRTLLKLKAAVMAEDDEIDETLGEKIDRRLTAPGDIAVRIMSMPSAKYVRGPAVADDDVKTAETLRRIAKGFYSMGVEVPNWQYLKVSYNRDEEYIRNELFGDTIRMQF